MMNGHAMEPMPMIVTLFSDELKVLKLCNIDEMSQKEISKEMGLSQTTVSRMLKRIHKKMTIVMFEDNVEVKVKMRK